MPINMSCPSCGKTLSAPDTAAGKKAKCPACGQIMLVPEAAQPSGDFGAPQVPPRAQQPAAGAGDNWLEGLGAPAQAAGAQAGTEGGGDRRPCPECGELIVAGAAKCRFCGAIFDPRLRAQKRASSSDESLTTGDWIFCILCAGIACIFGIVYAIQGKPKGMKMVGVSFAAAVIWNILNVILQLALNPHAFR